MKNEEFYSTHSIYIGEYNTLRDFHLFPTKRPFIAPPEPKTSFTEVTGMDGVLDYTNVLVGKPQYKDITGEWKFRFLYFENYEWNDLYHDLYTKLHGKYFDRISLEDDEEHFYRGRISVSWDEGDNGVEITLSYTLYPKKYREGDQPEVEEIETIKGTSYSTWNWENLLTTDPIYYGRFTVYGSKRRNLINPTGRTVAADAFCTSTFTAITDDGTTIVLPFGPNTNVLTLKPGDNIIDFYGNGDIQLDYALR